jgi:hypothetical protein
LRKTKKSGDLFCQQSRLTWLFFAGDKVEEAIENIKEAIQACLEFLEEDELENSF